VTDLFGKSVYVGLEPDLTSGVGRNRRLDHAGLYGYQLGSYNRLCDTVRIANCRHAHDREIDAGTPVGEYTQPEIDNPR
jgi:hypothetical protein